MQQHLASSCRCVIVFAFPEVTVPQSAWIIYLIQLIQFGEEREGSHRVLLHITQVRMSCAREADKLRKGTEYEMVLAVDDKKLQLPWTKLLPAQPFTVSMSLGIKTQTSEEEERGFSRFCQKLIKHFAVLHPVHQ